MATGVLLFDFHVTRDFGLCNEVFVTQSYCIGTKIDTEEL